ncbi:MAG: hypothetical protein WBG17_00645 [Burkholderiaceae bacterium]
MLADAGIGGSLVMSLVESWRVMELKKWSYPGSDSLVPPLYEPVLIGMHADRLFLRGWQRPESTAGRDTPTYFQEWIVVMSGSPPPDTTNTTTWGTIP